MFPRFVIGLVLSFLLSTPTIWFSLDHRRNVSDGVLSGIGTLFALDNRLYASDYDSDSDSVASGKPTLICFWLSSYCSLQNNCPYNSNSSLRNRGHLSAYDFEQLMKPCEPFFIYKLTI